MRLLISTLDLTRRGGSQLFVRDLALGLLHLGHQPVVHSPSLGPVASDIRGWSIPVTSDLRTLSAPPDAIIGNYHLGTMTALEQFPSCGALLVVHGFSTLIVPRFPRIHRYVAVDEPTRDALISVHGIDPASIDLLLSSVDLERFPARDALPPQPRRALMFGNQFIENAQMGAIRSACAARGIEVDHIGRGAEVHAEPEKILQQYDLVFARARCAIEAMATGAAVILTGPTRMGPLVTTRNVDNLRPLNFGRKVLRTPVSVDAMLEQIDLYDPVDSAAVSRRIRETASLGSAAATVLRISEEVVDRQRTYIQNPAAESLGMADYLASMEADNSMKFERFVADVSAWPMVGGVAVRIARKLKRRFLD